MTRIATQGPYDVVYADRVKPLLSEGVWMLHPPHDQSEVFVVSHIPTGHRAGSAFFTLGEARAWFDRLVRVAPMWGARCTFGRTPSPSTIRRLNRALAEDDGGADAP